MRGWITYDLQDRSRPRFVIYEPDQFDFSSEVVRVKWRIPKAI